MRGLIRYEHHGKTYTFFFVHSVCGLGVMRLRSQEGWSMKRKCLARRAIGDERWEKNGGIYIKVSDTRHKPTDWKRKNVLIWERMHGPIPKGGMVRFRNNNQRDFSIINLELITRSENMQRNCYQNYPKEISSLIQLQGAVNREINERIKHEQHRHA